MMMMMMVMMFSLSLHCQTKKLKQTNASNLTQDRLAFLFSFDADTTKERDKESF